MIDIEKNNKCCGCSACQQICPNDCITMVEDNEGFLYPYVDNDKCLKCNLCVKSCPIINKEKVEDAITLNNSYAAFNKNSRVVKKSASGGIFSILAEDVIKDGGIVCGCAFLDKLNATHIIINNVEDLEKLRGVKYIQSNINGMYKVIKEYLIIKRRVLFTGTPCQVAGLKQFLKVSSVTTENLLTIDVICHGVPNQRLFNEYISGIEKKKRIEIKRCNFREKSRKSWGHMFSYEFEKKGSIKKRCIGAYMSEYYYGFLNNIISRPICYECKYSSLQRQGDITLGDFWGVEKFNLNIKSDYGISALIINTRRGMNVISKNMDMIKLERTKIENIVARNSNLEKPSSRNALRNEFFTCRDKFGFDKAAKKYLKPKYYILFFIKSKIPFRFKEYIKAKF